MKNTSWYVGSGQRSSVTIPSSRSAADLTAAMAGNSGVRCSDAGPVEAVDEAGFARMRLTQGGGAQGERVAVAVAFGKRLKIGEQRDGRVILGRFPGGDHRLDARPRSVFLAGELIQSSFAGQSTGLLPSRLLFGALGSQPTLTIGSLPCGVVEQIGHGPAG
jgi:hypothetical protein